MATYSDREAFIPVTRTDLIDLCVNDGRLTAAQTDDFLKFTRILSAFLHFRSHSHLETLKTNFLPFNPDRETRQLLPLTPDELSERAQALVQAFHNVMRGANFKELSAAELERALAEESPMMKLRTNVRLDEFEHMAFYHRGQTQKPTEFGRLWWRKSIDIETLGRVALLLRFKGEDYFIATKQKLTRLPFEPGKLYLYLYKDVPRLDLEMLFPNVRLGMNIKDLIMLIIPALGAGIATLAKILPSLLLIIGVILLVLFGEDAVRILGINPDSLNSALPVVLAAVSAGAALAGYASIQYLKFSSKRLAFHKQVSDTLFFKNLANNEGVLTSLVDAAEDEEFKEIVLSYYHLLTSTEPLNRSTLDDRIEQWMQTKLDEKIDFDVHKGLASLADLSAPLGQGENQRNTPLLTTDENGFFQVKPLHDACAILDYVWDNIFQMNTELHDAMETA